MKKKIDKAKKYLEWNEPDQAIAELLPVLDVDQDYAWIPHHMMGIALSQKGDHKSSAEYLKKAIVKGSTVPETPHMLSVNHYNLGHLAEAEHYGKEAVAKKGDFLKAWLNLGSVYRAQAKLEEALECYQKANQIDPRNAGVAFRIGEIYRDQGDLEKALELFDITLKIDEDHLKAILEMADAYKKKGMFEKAEEWLEKAADKHGVRPSIQVSKAELYKSKGDYDKAIHLYERLLDEQPRNAALRVNYALCLQEVSRFDQSEAHYRQAIEDMPESRDAISNYLMGLHYNPQNTKEFIFDEHVRLGKKFNPVNNHGRPAPANVDKHKRLRVGFVSGGFRRHPVGFMIAGALEQLSDAQFEIYCYTTNNKYDFVTRRIHQNIAEWRSVVGYSANVIEDLIRKDELDILVDLSGHAADNCLDVMATEPAPVIVKWVGGLFNTTGIPAFDYLISDWHETPEGEERFYTEKLVRLPDDYISFTPPTYAPEVAGLPAEENGYITFGCFNNPTKVNDVVLERWAEIMRRVPDSRLFLKSKQYETVSFRDQILQVMAAEGISENRIEFQGNTSHDDHLGAYNKVDIALDPWPYSGGLTTCESLYMGVPVITLPGPTFAGRHSATHLNNAGLSEWITEDWEEYISRSVSLATGRQKLQQIRKDLRQKILSSPVCDGRRFGAHLSVAFRKMWEQRVDGYENGIQNWQDHIDIKPLSDSEIGDLTDGPEKTPLITIKDPENRPDGQRTEKEAQPIEENILNKDSVKKTISGTEELVQDIEHREGADNGRAVSMETDVTGPAKGGKEKDTCYINTKDGVTICTPADLELLTTYVMLEQKQWFEPELEFVRAYLKPGMQAVDVGAAFGAYALPMARQVGDEGKVYAFEPGGLAKKHLELSKFENGFEHLEVMGQAVGDEIGQGKLRSAETPELNAVDASGDEQISITTLDAWWAFAGQPEIDFIKVDANGMEPQTLAGATSLLERTSPVILVSIGEKENGLAQLHEQLSEWGYQLFEYIPGPGLLAEHEPEAGVDPYLMNVIAIKEDRIEKFKGTGWIFDSNVEVEKPGTSKWEEVLAKQPWTESLLDDWKQQISSGNHKEYMDALNLVCSAEQIDGSSDDPQSRSRKGAMMLAAAQKLIGLFNSGRAGVAAALTYVRVMQQLGKRAQAVEMMKELMETVNSGGMGKVQLPFLVPLVEQDTTSVQTDFQKWLTVRIVEAWITLQNPSTFMAGEQERQMMKALEGNPERSDKFLKIPSPNSKACQHIEDTNDLAKDWDNTIFSFLLKARPLEIKKHRLPSDLIVSITSYPDRFDTLHLTLACLLNQTVMPDRLILWIAYKDKKELPEEVIGLQKYGLEIKFCEDIKSFKKIIPTLNNNPDSYIVTADDDVYYWQTWLEELVKSWHINKDCVIAHRAHRIRKISENNLYPYSQWDLNYSQDIKPSGLNFPTGIGGVLYPPGVFHEDVTDRDLFMSLCPHGDDIWLYWMYRMKGHKVKITGKNRTLINWPQSQRGALWKQNLGNGRNDEQINCLISKYSFPEDGEESSLDNIFTVYTPKENYRIKLPNWETDHIQRIIATNNVPYELEMLKDMAQKVDPNDLIVDVGANIGNHSLFMATFAKCRVLAFEPNCHLANAFNATIELNNLSEKIVLIEKGIGQKPGYAIFEKEISNNLGAQRLKKTNNYNDQIEITTLDTQKFTNRLILLKVDVEGMELEVLRGGKRTIEKDLPIIYIEGKTKKEFNSIKCFLEPFGYRHKKTFNASPTHLFEVR